LKRLAVGDNKGRLVEVLKLAVGRRDIVITIGLLAQMQLGEIHVRLTAKAADEAAAKTLIAPLEIKVRERLGKAVFDADKGGV
jgi:hypothetical protein